MAPDPIRAWEIVDVALITSLSCVLIEFHSFVRKAKSNLLGENKDLDGK